MSVTLNVNGNDYEYPGPGPDEDWGADATDWAIAVTNGMLQKAGGLFQLLADVDFGTSFGLKSLYYKSRATTIASVGVLRLARADTIAWRNQANSADLELSVNSSNVLLFNGNPIQGQIAVTDTATIDLTFAADTLSADIKNNSITNAMINASAAIAYSKLNLTGGIVNADISASAAIAYSKLNLTGSIVNADINASAAIAYSKLALSNSIVNADINSSAAIAYSKLNLSGSIVNADVNASAAIALTKLAALTASRAMVTDSSGFASASSVTATELGYVSGVTSALQTQLNAKLNLSGGTMTGFLVLNADPVSGLQAATKDYVDASTGGAVLAGVGMNKVGVTLNVLVDASTIDVNGSNQLIVKSGGITATQIANTTITNTQISASAAIAYSKLNLATSIVNADISASAAIAYSKLNLATSIVNADISASAAIAGSKIVAAASGVIGVVTATTQTWTGLKTIENSASGGRVQGLTLLDTSTTGNGCYMAWQDAWSVDGGGVRGAIVADVPANNTGRIQFFTQTAASTLTQQAVLNTNGSWQFGTQSPDTVTQFKGNISAANQTVVALWLANGSSTTNAGLNIAKQSNNTTTSQSFIQFEVNRSTSTVGSGSGSGAIVANGANAATFASFSDKRLKKNIVDLPSQLENILALRPCEFDYKKGGHQIGFIAQELQEVYPDCVAEGSDDRMLMISGWSKTEARLVKAIQELKHLLDRANERISILEGSK